MATDLFVPETDTDFFLPVDEPPKPNGEFLTLRRLFETYMLKEIRGRIAEGTLSEYRTCLKHWEAHTRNPDIRQLEREDFDALAAGLAARGLRGATINKRYRFIRCMLHFAQKYLRVIDHIPHRYKSESKLVEEQQSIPREPITVDEVERLWRACEAASYPTGLPLPTAMYWRVALVLFWFYGPRTEDVFSLKWATESGAPVRLVDYASRLLRFRAFKTRKLQGLPMTDLVMGHLLSIDQGISSRVFPGFNSKGCQLAAGPVKAGFNHTWGNEIVPAAGLPAGCVLLKHFRQTMVTRNNGIEPGLGNWMAGHYTPGVSAIHYDNPTQRIRDAVAKTPVPRCFVSGLNDIRERFIGEGI